MVSLTDSLSFSLSSFNPAQRLISLSIYNPKVNKVAWRSSQKFLKFKGEKRAEFPQVSIMSVFEWSWMMSLSHRSHPWRLTPGLCWEAWALHYFPNWVHSPVSLFLRSFSIFFIIVDYISDCLNVQGKTYKANLSCFLILLLGFWFLFLLIFHYYWY